MIKVAILVDGENINYQFEQENNSPVPFDISPNTFILSDREKELILAYRGKAEMQPAIDKLLGIDTPQGINIGEDIAETVKKTQQSADIKCNSRSE